MKKVRELWRGTKIRKKILFIVSSLLILLLLVSAIKMFQIQHKSIWSENAIKPLYQYDRVVIRNQSSGETLNRKDLIQLYFILGATREYNSEKHQQYIPDGAILRNPRISFYFNEQYWADAACTIYWKYENNTLFVYDEGTGNKAKAKRYYIDKKNAELLHKLFEKNIINLDTENCGFN